MQLARLTAFVESDEFTSRLGAAAAVARPAGGAAAGAPPAAPGVPTPAQPVLTAVNQKIVKNILVMALLANPLLCVRGPNNTGCSELVNVTGSAPPFATAHVLELVPEMASSFTAPAGGRRGVIRCLGLRRPRSKSESWMCIYLTVPLLFHTVSQFDRPMNLLVTTSRTQLAACARTVRRNCDDVVLIRLLRALYTCCCSCF
jgi:hypothetical protein